MSDQNEFISDNTVYEIIEIDNKYKEISKINNINYISAIDILEFDFEKDFIVNGKFMFADQTHWNENGEVYFGKKLFSNSILKDILFP